MLFEDPHQSSDIKAKWKGTKQKVKEGGESVSNFSMKMFGLYRGLPLWVFFAIFSIMVFLFTSSFDFSFILTLGSLFQMFGFFLIMIWSFKSQSSAGLSFHALACFSLVCGARVIAVTAHTGYLPYDATGDWFYHISEILAVIFTIIVMVRIKGSNRYTYDRDYDKIKYYFMAIPCLVLAFFIHPTLNKNLFTDTAWAFSIYLECIAIFPQLLLMHNKKGVIEDFHGHYVAGQGFSKICYLIFWIETFGELNTDYCSHGDSMICWSLFPATAGYFIIAAQAIQLLIFLDFFINYFKSLVKGGPMLMSDTLVQ